MGCPPGPCQAMPPLTQPTLVGWVGAAWREVAGRPPPPVSGRRKIFPATGDRRCRSPRRAAAMGPRGCARGCRNGASISRTRGRRWAQRTRGAVASEPTVESAAPARAGTCDTELVCRAWLRTQGLRHCAMALTKPTLASHRSRGPRPARRHAIAMPRPVLWHTSCGPQRALPVPWHWHCRRLAASTRVRPVPWHWHCRRLAASARARPVPWHCHGPTQSASVRARHVPWHCHCPCHGSRHVPWHCQWACHGARSCVLEWDLKDCMSPRQNQCYL